MDTLVTIGLGDWNYTEGRRSFPGLFLLRLWNAGELARSLNMIPVS